MEPSAAGHVDERRGRVLFVGNVKGLAIGRQVEGLRLLDAADALDQLSGCRLVDDDDVVVGAADIELLAVLAEVNAARPPAGLETARDFGSGDIENGNGAAFLVGHVDLAGAGGRSIGGSGSQQHPHQQGVPPRLHHLSGLPRSGGNRHLCDRPRTRPQQNLERPGGDIEADVSQGRLGAVAESQAGNRLGDVFRGIGGGFVHGLLLWRTIIDLDTRRHEVRTGSTCENP